MAPFAPNIIVGLKMPDFYIFSVQNQFLKSQYRPRVPHLVIIIKSDYLILLWLDYLNYLNILNILFSIFPRYALWIKISSENSGNLAGSELVKYSVGALGLKPQSRL